MKKAFAANHPEFVDNLPSESELAELAAAPEKFAAWKEAKRSQAAAATDPTPAASGAAPIIPQVSELVLPASKQSKDEAASSPAQAITPTQYFIWTLTILAGLGAIAFVIKRKSE
jgi:hypothetical protein